MSWFIQYHHYVPASSMPIEMMRGALKAMQHCAAVRPGENVVISTDTNSWRIAEALAGAALAVGGIPTVVVIPPSIMGAHGAQVPKPVVGACRESDVFFLPTTWSQTHTDARVEAIRNDARGSTMCEVTEDCLCVGGIMADYEECDRLGRRLGGLLSKAKEVRITSPSGTDVRGEVSGRPVQYETGLFREPRQFAALPSSEINISPIEGTANGKVIVDVRLMEVGVTRYDQVTLTIRNGKLVNIEGGPSAVRFTEVLARFRDDTTYNIAEFGIGLNPMCREYATNLEDLGMLGHVHIGIGSNYAIGGKVKAPCHIDAIFRDAIVEFDGRIVIDRDSIRK